MFGLRLYLALITSRMFIHLTFPLGLPILNQGDQVELLVLLEIHRPLTQRVCYVNRQRLPVTLKALPNRFLNLELVANFSRWCTGSDAFYQQRLVIGVAASRSHRDFSEHV